MRPNPVNRRKPAVVSVRTNRANGMTVLIQYRAMQGPIQTQGQPITSFPLAIIGATDPETGIAINPVITSWRQVTNNTVEVSFNASVRGFKYEYADNHPYFLAYSLPRYDFSGEIAGEVGLPIAGKRGTVG